MKLETPMIALMIGSLLFTGMFTVFVTNLGEEYDAEMDLSEFTTQNGEMSLQESFDKVNETKAKMDDLNARYQNEKISESGNLYGFYKLTKTVGEQMLSSTNVLKELLYGMSGILGIPPIFITVAITIIVALLIISIVMILAGVSYN